MTLRLIAGTFKGRLIKAPTTSSTRPTQSMLREAVFNICQMEIQGARFLDLFAGSGAMGLEALSRGASHATFVENHPAALRCIRTNIDTLQVGAQASLLPLSAAKALTVLTQKQARFDLVYVDPPYDKAFDLTSLLPLLAPDALLFLEERHDPKQAHSHPVISHLPLINTRRFGTALLSTFQYKESLDHFRN